MKETLDTIAIEAVDEHRLVVRLSRPASANALNTAMGLELRDLFTGFYVEPGEVRCVVLTGAGEKAFCAGGDLKERNGMTDAAWQRQHAIFEQMTLAVVECPIPIIAAVNGAAYGGGAELALACDFIYAARRARFALTEVTLGIMPGALGPQNLARAAGVRRAKEAVLTGLPFGAEEALAWGVANRVCENDALLDEALATAARIASNAPARDPARQAHHVHRERPRPSERLRTRSRGLQPPGAHRRPPGGGAGLQREAARPLPGPLRAGRAMPAASAIRERLGSAGVIAEGLESVGYISSRAIATAVHVAAHLEKPILVEGSAGVGKTELALSVGRYLGLPLVRLQCYEGLDESKALYEWKYGKQLLYTQILKDRMSDVLRDADGFDGAMARLHEFGDLFFSEEFLEPRPLLRALREEGGAVLLIDEIDKSDEEFEAFLLEVLSAHQVTIPELGTVHADMPPVTFLTSNNTRDLGDALKRRCLHLHIPLPEARLERRIVETRVPEAGEALRRQLVDFVQQLRTLELRKLPSISETIDWARALVLLNAHELERELVRDTLNVLLKFEVDVERADRELPALLAHARREGGAAAAPRLA